MAISQHAVIYRFIHVLNYASLITLVSELTGSSLSAIYAVISQCKNMHLVIYILEHSVVKTSGNICTFVFKTSWHA